MHDFRRSRNEALNINTPILCQKLRPPRGPGLKGVIARCYHQQVAPAFRSKPVSTPHCSDSTHHPDVRKLIVPSKPMSMPLWDL